MSRAKVQRPILLPAASVECEDLLGRRFESIINLEGMAINNICLQNIHFLSFRLGDRRKENRCPEVDMFRTVTETIFSGLSNYVFFLSVRKTAIRLLHTYQLAH